MGLERDFRALERKIDRLERMKLSTLKKNYKKVLDDLLLSLSKIYAKYEIDGQLTFDDMSKYNRLNQIDKLVKEIGMKLYSENSKLTRETLRRVYEDTYASTKGIIEGSSKKSLKAIMKPQNVTKTVNSDMAGLVWTKRLKKGRADFIYNLESAIKQGLRNGDRYSTIARKLKEVVGEDLVNPERIVRTEAHRIRTQAKIDVTEEASKQGIEMVKIWLSMGDERVRSLHQSMDRMQVGVDENFILPDGSTGKGPGHMGVAKHDINCRCQLIYELK